MIHLRLCRINLMDFSKKWWTHCPPLSLSGQGQDLTSFFSNYCLLLLLWHLYYVDITFTYHTQHFGGKHPKTTLLQRQWTWDLGEIHKQQGGSDSSPWTCGKRELDRCNCNNSRKNKECCCYTGGRVSQLSTAWLVSRPWRQPRRAEWLLILYL